MDLKELHRHSKAVVEAEKAGISLLWNRDFSLETDLFFEFVTSLNLSVETQRTSTGKYQLSFSINGSNYFAFINEEEYETLREEKSHKKRIAL